MLAIAASNCAIGSAAIGNSANAKTSFPVQNGNWKSYGNEKNRKSQDNLFCDCVMNKLLIATAIHIIKNAFHRNLKNSLSTTHQTSPTNKNNAY